MNSLLSMRVHVCPPLGQGIEDLLLLLLLLLDVAVIGPVQPKGKEAHRVSISEGEERKECRNSIYKKPKNDNNKFRIVNKLPKIFEFHSCRTINIP